MELRERDHPIHRRLLWPPSEAAFLPVLGTEGTGQPLQSGCRANLPLFVVVVLRH